MELNLHSSADMLAFPTAALHKCAHYNAELSFLCFRCGNLPVWRAISTMTPATRIELFLVTCGVTLAVAVGVSALIVKVPTVPAPPIYSQPVWDRDHYTMQLAQDCPEKGQASYLSIHIIHHLHVTKTVANKE